MDTLFVIFVIGEDKPGIVAAVSEVLYRHNVNIEDSSMSILKNHFAMIILVSAKTPVTLSHLKGEFREVEERLSLFVSIKKLAPAQESDHKLSKSRPYIITVIGKDRTGIVFGVTDLLARRSMNILDLRTEIIGETENPVYTMIIEFEIPPRGSVKELEKGLKALEKMLNVTITLKPIEILNL